MPGNISKYVISRILFVFPLYHIILGCYKGSWPNMMLMLLWYLQRHKIIEWVLGKAPWQISANLEYSSSPVAETAVPVIARHLISHVQLNEDWPRQWLGKWPLGGAIGWPQGNAMHVCMCWKQLLLQVTVGERGIILWWNVTLVEGKQMLWIDSWKKCSCLDEDEFIQNMIFKKCLHWTDILSNDLHDKN